MRDKEEHIDKIFRNGLASYEVNPPSDMWPAINEGLFHRVFKNKLLHYFLEAPAGVWPVVRAGIAIPARPHYLRITAAAAVIAIFLSGSWWAVQRNFFSPDPDQMAQTEISAVTLRDSPESGTDLVKGIEYNSLQIVSPGNKSPVLLANNSLLAVNAGYFASGDAHNTLPVETNEFSQNAFLKPTGITADILLTDPDVDRYFSVVETKSILNFSDFSTAGSYSLIAMSQAQKSESSRWAVSGNVSPLFSFRYAKTEPSAEGLNYFYEKESGIISYSGGVNAVYNLKKRLSIQTGVQFSRGGQRINDVIFYQDIQTGRLLSSGIFNENIPYPFETSTGRVTSGDYVHYIADFKLVDGDLYTGDLIARPEFENYEALHTYLTQNLEFVEIPVILKYKLVDRKLGINVLSGLGASFLVDNSVYMNYMGEQFPIGQTENLRVVNLTGTFGLGLEYSVNRMLSLNLEPTFKYFLNSLNTESHVSSHPYFFGVYSGVSVSF